MIKKVIAFLFLLSMALCITGCTSTNSDSILNDKLSRDGYEYAYFEEYNSYAEENGLADTPVYIQGTVKSVYDFAGSCNLSVVSDDEGRWLVSFPDTKCTDRIIQIFDEKEVICYGKYLGFSDVVLMPVISVDKVEANGTIYTAENLAKLDKSTTNNTEEQSDTEVSTQVESYAQKLDTDEIDVETETDETSKQESGDTELSQDEDNKLGKSYQYILDEYSEKLREATPELIDEYNSEAANNTDGIMGLAELCNSKVSKLAEIYTEGVGEMANYMYSKSSGSYSEYESWAGKLYSVYEEEAAKIQNAYIESAM